MFSVTLGGMNTTQGAEVAAEQCVGPTYRELEDLSQEAALRAWLIHQEQRRNRRRLIRWALLAKLRATGAPGLVDGQSS